MDRPRRPRLGIWALVHHKAWAGWRADWRPPEAAGSDLAGGASPSAQAGRPPGPRPGRASSATAPQRCRYPPRAPGGRRGPLAPGGGGGVCPPAPAPSPGPVPFALKSLWPLGTPTAFAPPASSNGGPSRAPARQAQAQAMRPAALGCERAGRRPCRASRSKPELGSGRFAPPRSRGGPDRERPGRGRPGRKVCRYSCWGLWAAVPVRMLLPALPAHLAGYTENSLLPACIQPKPGSAHIALLFGVCTFVSDSH